MTARSSARPAWPRMSALGFGGDYNPEQWPREVWDEDMRLMKKAGVNVVSIGIFSWSVIQPSENDWSFEWLDDLMDLLWANGISVDLATATASPPPWLTSKHPDILPITDRGEIQWPGGRQQWRPTSPIFRRYALAIVRKLADRYGSHPALVAWHVNNELGCHNHFDYSDDAATAFREWLQTRYGDIGRLNSAWETAFWSQRYSSFAEVLPPRLAPKGTWPNPGQTLDWKRFSSDALLDYYRSERDILHQITPSIPVTTNFMIMGPGKKDADYAAWAKEMDFVSNDHYVTAGGRDEASFSASFCAGISGDRPWWLMEHSTSAVNWHPINTPKERGEMFSESLTHLAHGADALCFFQWRQSKAGGERYHSSMLPHAGEESRIFKDVCSLGQHLKDLAELQGSTMKRAPIAIVLDQQSWWTSEMNSHPTSALSYHGEALEWYVAAMDLGLRVDVVPLDAPLDQYAMVIAPILYSVTDRDQSRLIQYATRGHLILTYFSGIVDESVHMRLGGYPGAFRELLGIRIEEFCPLPSGVTVKLSGGETGSVWTDPIDIASTDVEILRTYSDWRWAGQPAVTRQKTTGGSASYVSTRLDVVGRRGVLQQLAADAGIDSDLPERLRGKVEHTIRTDGKREWHFLVNRSGRSIDLEHDSSRLVVNTSDKAAELARYGVAVFATGGGESLRA